MNNALERKQQVEAVFRRIYRRSPEIWARAPGRVDLMGSHTDYNQGYVMTMTIDRDTWVVAAPRSDRCVRVCSMNIEGCGEFNLDELDPRHPYQPVSAPWVGYVAGVAWALQADGLPLTGFDGLVHSTVPFGSGLSSSAALEMAVGVAFEALGGYIVDRVRLAKLGQRAENEYVGLSCGILDQFSSANGAAGSTVLLDCRSLDSQIIPIAAELGVMICDTRAERRLVGSEYCDRRAQCEAGAAFFAGCYPGVTSLRDVTPQMLFAHTAELPQVVYRRCRFIIEENRRVLDLARYLPAGDADCLKVLFSASFAGARDLYEITVPAMEAMYAAISGAPGVVGGRQAGAGFGGCLVALIHKSEADAFAGFVRESYARRTGIEPNVYPVQASDGAGILSFGFNL